MWQKVTQNNLPFGQGDLIALVGAGGKSSCMRWLAQQLRPKATPILITTSTRIFWPNENDYDHLLLDPTLEALLAPEPGITLAARRIDGRQDKLCDIPSQWLDQLNVQGCYQQIIVEADGSRGLPLKAPAHHEPVVPNCAHWVIGIVGADSLFKPALPAQIHRWNEFRALSQINEGDPIDAAVLTTLIEHPDGLFKNCPTTAQRIMLLNKCDRAPQQALEHLAQQLISNCPSLAQLWLGQFQPSPSIHKIIKEQA